MLLNNDLTQGSSKGLQKNVYHKKALHGCLNVSHQNNLASSFHLLQTFIPLELLLYFYEVGIYCYHSRFRDYVNIRFYSMLGVVLEQTGKHYGTF